MSASAWDQAVEAAEDAMWSDKGISGALAAALPVLLNELADRIQSGHDAILASARGADPKYVRYAAIKAEGVRCALGTVRGFAAEVTQ